MLREFQTFRRLSQYQPLRDEWERQIPRGAPGRTVIALEHNPNLIPAKLRKAPRLDLWTLSASRMPARRSGRAGKSMSAQRPSLHLQLANWAILVSFLSQSGADRRQPLERITACWKSPLSDNRI